MDEPPPQPDAPPEAAETPGDGTAKPALKPYDRRRKTKCDIKRPVCGLCMKGGFDCSYDMVKKRKGRPPGSKTRSKQQNAEQEESNSATTSSVLTFQASSSFSPSAVASSAHTAVRFALTPPASSASPVAAAPPRSIALDDIVPASTIQIFINLFFDKVAPLYPIFFSPSIKADFLVRRDRVDSRFHEYVLSLCAATAVCLHAEPMPESLRDTFSSWEDAGRTFNLALKPRRLRAMFMDRDVSVIQNIILVLIYELALGSTVAYHLTNEAIRFSIAYGYYREGSGDDLVKNELQKRVFWLLFVWDKIASLYSGAPMALRSDEVSSGILSNFVTSLPNPDSITGQTLQPHDPESDDPQSSLSFFRNFIGLGICLEEVLLQHRRDVRLTESNTDVRASFHQQIARVMAMSTDVPLHSANSRSESDRDISQVQTGILSIMQQSICLEIYLRYMPLLRDEVATLPLAMASIAVDILQTARNLGSRLLNRAGPIPIDMVKRSHVLLVDILPALDGADPFSRVRSAQAASNFANFAPEIDQLRVAARGDHPSAPQSPNAPLASPFVTQERPHKAAEKAQGNVGVNSVEERPSSAQIEGDQTFSAADLETFIQSLGTTLGSESVWPTNFYLTESPTGVGGW
ncbi:hypothetical protein T439DRAFT_360002 [Meredithblackwellia eburnea MCA 4105]